MAHEGAISRNMGKTSVKATARLILFIFLLPLFACAPAGDPVDTARATASPSPPAVTATLPPTATSAPSPDGVSADAGRPVAAYPRQAVDAGDPTMRPSELHGDELVFVNQEGHVMLHDVARGETRQVTETSAFRWDAVLNHRYVAWIEQVGERTAVVDGREERVVLAHVVVHERTAGTEQTITGTAAPRYGLALDGERLVWMDRRNEMEEHYSFYDLYAYDLAAGIEVPIAVAPGVQEQAAIDGDLVVWRDNRNNPERDGRWAGCANCPENQADIYLYDFASGEARTIVENGRNNGMPTIGDDRVAWIQFESHDGDVYLLDLGSGEQRRVTETAGGEESPRLFGDGRLGWTVRTACDVIEIDEGGREVEGAYGVYVLDLGTGKEERLSDFKEPRALFYGDRVAITEGCMTGFETVVVDLEGAP